MNAIEQMMQAFGANSAQSLSAFSGSGVSDASGSEFAAQFAAAIQGIENSSPIAQAISDGSLSLYAVTSIEGDANPELVIKQLQDQLGGATSTATTDTSAQSATKTSQAGFQLVKVTPENFATLFGSAEASGQLASTDQTINPQLLVLEAATGQSSGEVHILPAKELEALLSLSAGSGASVSNPADALAASSTQATTSTSVTGVAPQAATATSANSGNPDISKTVEQALQQVAQGKNEASVEQAAEKTLAERAGETAAAKTVKEQPSAAAAKAQKTNEGEANGVQSQQAAASQATASKKTAANNAAGTASNATPTQAAATAASAQSASNNQSGGQKQSKPEDRAATNAALKKAASAPAAAAVQTAPLSSLQSSWTPERVLGTSETFNADVFSGGLSGLRGESGFMASMGIIGGKASPNMGGQIAKQLNLQITNAVKNGQNEFTMRLNPAELGKVQVKMQFTGDGKVAAQIVAERPETLELLQREVKGLERAIESGGHKADPANISFSLDTGNGESAGKAFTEAMHKDRMQEKLEQDATDDGSSTDQGAFSSTDETDLAMLEEILSRVTPETGLDVRV